MIRVLTALALAAAFPTACSKGDDVRAGVDRVCGPDVARAPCAGGVEDGVPYRFELLTHCGVEWAYFDGRYWVPRPKVDPESDWTPIERGTMTLVRRGEALFEGGSHGEARFVPAPTGYRPQPCA